MQKATPTQKVRKKGVYGAPIVARRAVTPGRKNKNSLPDKVLARLILDVDAQKNAYTFLWHPELFEGLNRNRVRKKFGYYVELKLDASPEEFDREVKWARSILSESTNPSRMSSCPCSFFFLARSTDRR